MATNIQKLSPQGASRTATPPEPANAFPAKPKRKLFRVLSIFLLAIVLGSATGWYFLGQGSTQGAAKETGKTAPPVFITLEPFTVNLQPEIGDQYLQTAMTLQVPDQDNVERIKLYMPMVRSRVLVLLTSKKASEISTPEGKAQLAGDIIQVLNKPFSGDMPAQQVASVFFTSFVIQ